MMTRQPQQQHRQLTTPETLASLNCVPLRECGEPLVDLRQHCREIVLGSECRLPFLRTTVAEMLNTACTRLPDGWRLKLTTALRSLEEQRRLYDEHVTQLRAAHPRWGYATLRRQANRFFAPVDQKAPPGHCTGGAVDVVLLGPDEQEADLTTPLTGWRAAPTLAKGLSPLARINRALLLDAMLAAGFSNYAAEYWHYSYGDAGWAVRTGAEYCIYGAIDPPAL